MVAVIDRLVADSGNPDLQTDGALIVAAYREVFGPKTRTIPVVWAPHALEGALEDLLRVRDNPDYRLPLRQLVPQTVQVAVDCLRAVLREED